MRAELGNAYQILSLKKDSHNKPYFITRQSNETFSFATLSPSPVSHLPPDCSSHTGCVTGSYVSFWLDYSHPPSSAADRDRQMAIRTQKDTGRNAHKDTDRDPDRKIILVEDRKLDEDR